MHSAFLHGDYLNERRPTQCVYSALMYITTAMYISHLNEYRSLQWMDTSSKHVDHIKTVNHVNACKLPQYI